NAPGATLDVSAATVTGSASTPLINAAGIWNTSGTPTAFKLNITDTASNAASLLADLQIGGVSQFSVDKSGVITSTSLTSIGTQCLQANSTGVITGTGSACGSGGGSSALSSLTAASATNSINNANFAQTWQWNALTSNSGFTLSSTSTAAASNTQTILNIATSGANASSTQTTYGQQIANTHTGTASTNVGLSVSASGGTNNYGLLVASGSVGIGTATPGAKLDLVQNDTEFLAPSFFDPQLNNAHASLKNTATETVNSSIASDFTYGSYTTATVNGSSISPAGVAGSSVQGAYTGTGAIGQVAGQLIYATDSAAAALPSMIGSQINRALTGGSANTLSIGQEIGTPNVIGGSTIASNYGLYIDDQKTAGITNTYAIFSNQSAGSTSYAYYGQGAAQSYFGGAVGIGNTAPAADLDITSLGANKISIRSQGYSLTGTNASSLVDLSGTWNTSGNPTAIKLNVTNTASGASALLQDLQVGSVSQFKVAKNGNVTAVGTITGSNFSGTSSGTNTGDVTLSGQNYLSLTGQAITANAINLSGSNVTSILGSANGGTGVNNGSSTITLAGNLVTVGANALTLTTTGTTNVTLPTAGTLAILGANTFTATQTINPAANTSALIASGYSLTGSNAQSLLDLSGTWNTSGTPTAFKLNVTDTASNAASLLADLQVGSTSKFKVDKAGAITSTGLLSVTNSTTASGVNAIASILTNSTLTNSTASGFQFGSRMLNTVNGTTAGTEEGLFLRMTDSTSLANTVRGLEIQAYSGTNTAGTNTGILAFGKTFGVQGVTTAEAGGVSVPAGLYGELANSAAPTVGNAIRAYSGAATSATLLSVYHDTSAFTGNGLVVDLGNGTGSFASGNFISLRNAGTEKMHVSSTGATFVSLPGTQTTIALCHTNNGQTNNDEIVDCSGAPSDLAENFGTDDPTISAGDLVVGVGEAQALISEGFKTSKAFMTKSTSAYQSNILGVVSTQPNQTYADTLFDPSENPRPIALVGRVPVKVNLEGGVIHPGDYITSSSTSGFGMKANNPGMVVGQALQTYDGTQAINLIIVFVNPFYYDPSMITDASGNVTIQRNSGITTLIAQTTTGPAYLINQKGSGDLLQLQTNGSDRFLVKNDGTISINTQVSNLTNDIFVVNAGTTPVLRVNSRGDLALKGIISIEENSFAGSINTATDGTANIDFAYDLGDGKPVVELTVEGEVPAFAQIVGWKQDPQNNYTGFAIKTFDTTGAVVQTTVHYLVVKKQTSYSTQGPTIQVVTAPQNTASSNSTATPPTPSTTITPDPTVDPNTITTPPATISANPNPPATPDSNASTVPAAITTDPNSAPATATINPPDPTAAALTTSSIQ
ncbi:MAG: hypothetical protein JWO40_891, partial [Candidatus Doudnabacteria bacterium]|nr:hypothetical protein [Candidatus Doudnabacteria bacterium]